MPDSKSRRSVRRPSVVATAPNLDPPNPKKYPRKKKAEKDPSSGADDKFGFVSAETFNFNSPKGVMTRARRSSIYVSGKNANQIGHKKPTLAPVHEVQKPVRARKPPVPKMSRKTSTSTRPKATEKMPPSFSPAKSVKKKEIFKDVEIVVKRLEDTPAKNLVSKEDIADRLIKLQDSPKRVQLVSRQLIREVSGKQLNESVTRKRKTSAKKNLVIEEEEEKETTPDEIKKRRTPAVVTSKRMTRASRSSRKPSALQMEQRSMNRFSPAMSEKMKKAQPMKPASFYGGTPHATNPNLLLRNNLKNIVKDKMEERVQTLPPSSPYEISEVSTENGSPAHRFTKLKEKPAESNLVSKFITSTPGLGGLNQTRSRRILGGIDNNKTLTDDDGRKTNKKMKLDFEESDAENEEKQNSPISNSESPKIKFNEQLPELVTGNLANVCSIM